MIAPKVLCSLHEPAHFHFHFSFFYFFLLDSSLGPPLASRTFCGEEERPFLGLLHQKEKKKKKKKCLAPYAVKRHAPFKGFPTQIVARVRGLLPQHQHGIFQLCVHHLKKKLNQNINITFFLKKIRKIKNKNIEKCSICVVIITCIFRNSSLFCSRVKS